MRTFACSTKSLASTLRIRRGYMDPTPLDQLRSPIDIETYPSPIVTQGIFHPPSALSIADSAALKSSFLRQTNNFTWNNKPEEAWTFS